MPINAGIEFQKAERKYAESSTNQEKLIALNEMLRTAPKHKSSQVLLSDIKGKIAKYKELLIKKTLIGPHRDEYYIFLVNKSSLKKDIHMYGSRSEQRLSILWLKFWRLIR